MEKEIIKKLLERNEGCKFQGGKLCSHWDHCCRECRYIEMDYNPYSDNTRRCSYFGKWVNPYDTACGNFRE